MSKEKQPGAEGRQETEYWVIEHKGRVVALIRAQGERHAKKQAISWARGRTRQGVLWRDVQVRPQGQKPTRYRWPNLGREFKRALVAPVPPGQSVTLMALLSVMAWLWQDLV